MAQEMLDMPDLYTGGQELDQQLGQAFDLTTPILGDAQPMEQEEPSEEPSEEPDVVKKEKKTKKKRPAPSDTKKPAKKKPKVKKPTKSEQRDALTWEIIGNYQRALAECINVNQALGEHINDLHKTQHDQMGELLHAQNRLVLAVDTLRKI